MGSRINYIVLFVVITIGVATGNLLSNWITAIFFETEVEKAITEISENTAKETSMQTKKVEQAVKKEQEVDKIQEITNQEYLMKQRELDDIGIRLAKKCSEWQIAHKDMQTQTSERGMKKHCEEYENYIETGVLPNN